MQKLNVLIAGEDFLEEISKSKFLNKLFLTSKKEFKDAITINFNTFQELAQKCKALKVDLVIVENEKWILQGIADVLRANYINCIAPSASWTKLATSNFYSREILQKYGISVPETVLLPTEFPVTVRADGFSKIANSLQETINIKKEICNLSSEVAETIYIEKNIDGERCILTSLYDGQNLLTFYNNNFDIVLQKQYSKKLENMFNTEKAGFTGLINSEIIVSRGIIYNIGFNFKFVLPEQSNDLLYLFISALYQKLNEIE